MTDLDWLHDGEAESGDGESAGTPTPTVPPECEADLLALLSAPVEPHENSYIEQQVRRVSRRAYVPWSAQEDTLLLRLSEANFTEADLVQTLCRQPGAIRSRLKRLTDDAASGGDEGWRQKQEARRERRQERWARQNRRSATPVPLELVVPHFEAWLALLRAGTPLDVMENGRVVFSMVPPAALPERPPATGVQE